MRSTTARLIFFRACETAQKVIRMQRFDKGTAMRLLFQRAAARFQARRTWYLYELSDWALALIGIISFLIAGYWGMAVADVLQDLVKMTNRGGLSWIRTAGFALLGLLGIAIWFYGCIAARCHSSLFERHFR